MPISSDFVQSPATRRQTAGWGNLYNPLSQPDRDYLENKAAELQAPGYVSDDYARTMHLLQQDNQLSGRGGIKGPAMLALSRSGNPGGGGGGRPPIGPGGGGPGQLPDATAMNFALADPTIGYHKLALEDAVQGQQERASALMSPTASQRLHSGQAGFDARATGDILRDEMLRNATAKGTAASNEYLAPGQDDARRQRLWDDEKRQQLLSPYSPQNITGQLAYQRELAKGQYGLAGDQATAESRTNAAVANAIRGLIASGAIANTPEVQNALIQQGLGIVTGGNQGQPQLPPGFGEPAPGYGPRPQGPPRPQQPVLPSSGFMPPPAGGQQGGTFNPAPDFNRPLQPFPRAQLAEYARQYGMSEDQAEEYLRRFQGYQVQ